jgi:hypothetical protein
LLWLDNCQRVGITNHPNLAMVYPTRRTKLCRIHCPTHKKTSESKAFCTSKQQNNQTWINLTWMGTFSNQKKNICSHLKRKDICLQISSRYCFFQFLQVVTHIDHYYIYALQVHAIKSGNSQSSYTRYGLQKSCNWNKWNFLGLVFNVNKKDKKVWHIEF